MGVERVEDIDDADLMTDLMVRVYAESAGADESGFSTVAAGTHIVTSRDALAPTQTVTATDAVSRAQATRERNQRQEQTGRADLPAGGSVPREVIVPIEPNRREEIERWLTDLRGGTVSIRVAVRGDKKQLMDRANENASQALQRAKMSVSTIWRARAIDEVAEALGLEEAPLRIECYDISNTVGSAFRLPPWWCSRTRSRRKANISVSPYEAMTARVRSMIFPHCMRL